MAILVIDVGTSSIRGILYDEKGEELSVWQIPYQVHFSGEGVIAEQDPADWHDSVVNICREAAAYEQSAGEKIEALSLTSQRSSIIPVGKDGAPLRPAIMWQDKRNGSIVQEFQDVLGHVGELTGARINTVFSGTKMTWLHRNEPELYKKTEKICTIADYIVHQITGQYRTDHTYGSRSLLMNIRTRAWDDELLDIFEVDREKLCDLVQPGTVIGTVSKDFAGKTGLACGIPLVSAGGDQQCAALGHGVTESGIMEITTGTGAFIIGCCEAVPNSLKNDVICGAHAIPGKYVLESSMLACAAMYNWSKGILFSEETGYEGINQAVKSSPIGAGGVVALPYFQGRGTPEWDSSATGCFANLNLGTTRGDLARAILESIACEAGINIKVLRKYIGNTKKIYIGGGLTKFDEFNRIQADVYQEKLFRNAASSEQSAFGAWASAAVALGLYDDYDGAMSYVRGRCSYEIYDPVPENTAFYQKKTGEMIELYKSMPVFAK